MNAMIQRMSRGVMGPWSRNILETQFQLPRGRWVSRCERHPMLAPRNGWTPGNATLTQERRA